MKVFKFGGASVKDAAAIRNLRVILQRYPDENLLVVISAMGKTTNFMEKITDAYYRHREQIPALVQELQRHYSDVAQQLDTGNTNTLTNCLQPLFGRLHEELAREHSHNYDYDYDRIVCFGELLTTTLIAAYLNMVGMENRWVDARRVIRTNSTFREARVNWPVTGQLIRETIENPDISSCRLIITQGFIGGTAEDLTTTLGREGSDYSAAIFAHALDADSVTIWKDVDGFFNADPKRFPDAVKLDSIPYKEAVELAYYGTSIIHPKTVKPLENKNIPLYVKSFYHPEQPGSVITDCPPSANIPSYIVKDRQLLLTVLPRDLSFMTTDNLSEIFAILSQYRVKINLMQNSALSLSVCVDDVPERTEACMMALTKKYRVKFNKDVELITVRHYTPDCMAKMTAHRQILLKQISRTTLQIVISFFP